MIHRVRRPGICFSLVGRLGYVGLDVKFSSIHEGGGA